MIAEVWTVYKEVQAYYEAGLNPPSDVTIMFADDNWGNIRRLPTEKESERTGGFGVSHRVGLPPGLQELTFLVALPSSWICRATQELQVDEHHQFGKL